MGPQGITMGPQGITMGPQGDHYLTCCVAGSQTTWGCMGMHGTWDVMGCHGMPWDAMGCHGMSWDAKGFTKTTPSPSSPPVVRDDIGSGLKAYRGIMHRLNRMLNGVNFPKLPKWMMCGELQRDPMRSPMRDQKGLHLSPENSFDPGSALGRALSRCMPKGKSPALTTFSAVGSQSTALAG